MIDRFSDRVYQLVYQWYTYQRVGGFPLQRVTLLGAGGKMGTRITNNLVKSAYGDSTQYVEVSSEGQDRLKAKGLRVSTAEEAIPGADLVILALPDRLIGKLSPAVVQLMKPGAMVVLLDPAAAYLGQLPIRHEVSFFVTHPCHTPVFNDEVDAEARQDYFGGVKAKQAIVCALGSGPEADYARGEDLAKVMYGPILRSHRITVDQMAILEPAMAETVACTLSTILRDSLAQAIKAGVPAEAARDFMLGHIHIGLSIALGQVGFNFSDACLVAIDYGRASLIKEGWEKVFDHKSIKEQVDVMLHPEKLTKVLQAIKG